MQVSGHVCCSGCTQPTTQHRQPDKITHYDVFCHALPPRPPTRAGVHHDQVGPNHAGRPHSRAGQALQLLQQVRGALLRVGACPRVAVGGAAQAAEAVAGPGTQEGGALVGRRGGRGGSKEANRMPD
jgi:hypothetical protein